MLGGGSAAARLGFSFGTALGSGCFRAGARLFMLECTAASRAYVNVAPGPASVQGRRAAMGTDDAMAAATLKFVIDHLRIFFRLDSAAGFRVLDFES